MRCVRCVLLCGCAGVHQHLTRLLSHDVAQLNAIVKTWRSLIDSGNVMIDRAISDAQGGAAASSSVNM